MEEIKQFQYKYNYKDTQKITIIYKNNWRAIYEGIPTKCGTLDYYKMIFDIKNRGGYIMKNKYMIEFYNFEKNVSQGVCNDCIYTNKKSVTADAKYIYKSLCFNDKKHTSILVNKYNFEFNEWNCIAEIKR